MLCKAPFVSASFLPHGCGQCLPCLIKRRRIWSHRVVLESLTHPKNSFVTLTYDPEHVPEELIPDHLTQVFLRGLRDRTRDQPPLRYYGVGEYGEQHNRPHYHLALFGRGMQDAEVIDRSWPYGFTYTGELTAASAQYVAGYVCNKMFNPNNPHHEFLLSGRHPEFSRMSLKPGIGYGAIPYLQDALTTEAGCQALGEIGDVPHALTHGRKSQPLGSYLRSKLRIKMGVSEDGKIPKESLDNYKKTLRELYGEETTGSRYATREERYKQRVILLNEQKVLSLETKHRIFKQKETL